jgi:transcriptional regulator with XRE-family HTH domain
MSNFAQRLVARRTNLNMTQEELSDKAGISVRSITSWESGLNPPSMRNVEKISEVLGVSPAWLLGGEHKTEAERIEFVDRGNELPWQFLTEPTLRRVMAELSQNSQYTALAHIESIVAELRSRPESKPLKAIAPTIQGVTKKIAQAAEAGALAAVEIIKREKK